MICIGMDLGNDIRKELRSGILDWEQIDVQRDPQVEIEIREGDLDAEGRIGKERGKRRWREGEELEAP